MVAPVCEVMCTVMSVFEIVAECLKNQPISMLENFTKTHDKFLISILRLLPSYTSTNVVSVVISKGRSFSKKQIRRENLVLIRTKLGFGILSRFDSQLLTNLDGRIIRKTKSREMSKQTKSVRRKFIMVKHKREKRFRRL